MATSGCWKRNGSLWDFVQSRQIPQRIFRMILFAAEDNFFLKIQSNGKRRRRTQMKRQAKVKERRKRIPLGSDYPTKTIAGRLVRISAISARLSFVLHSCRGFCGFVCARICFAVVVPVHFHLNNQINLIGFFVVVEIRAIY